MKKINNLEELRRRNLTDIMKRLFVEKQMSRAELAEASGLQQSTVTNLVGVLLDNGIVEETGLISGKRGRRSIGLTLSKDCFVVIGIRLTRTDYTVGRFLVDGTCEERVARTFEIGASIQVVLNGMKDEISRLISSSTRPVKAIGVAVPGPFMVTESRFMNVSGMSNWEGVNIKEYLNGYFDIPVYVEHDANAGILAEFAFGKSDFPEGSYLYIAGDYGIGAGLMVNYTIQHGAIGIAGEIGHMSIDVNGPKCVCGNNGCLEMYASTHAIVEYVKRKRDASADIMYQDILHAYRAGDPLATEAFQYSAYYLGRGLANLMNIFNPNGIIIGGGLAEAGERYIEAVQASARQFVYPEVYNNTEIRLSVLMQDPPLLGAAMIAYVIILNDPETLITK